MSMKLICAECGGEHPVDEMIYRCERCDYPLEVRYDYDALIDAIDPKALRERGWDIWRCRELLPIKKSDFIVSLREGGTPLIRAPNLGEALGLREVYVKDETRNPTWSFKDRGSSVGVSKALEIGARAVGCASSGNMAASLASYAARAGIKSIVLIPRKTPMGKIAQMLVCGAEVASLEAPYPEIHRAFLRSSIDFGVYMVHNDAPMRVEGQKTVSFEIAEQLEFDAPDWLLVPTSSAGNFSAVWKGWAELNLVGLIDAAPKMGLVQAMGNAPIVTSFRKGLDYVQPNSNPDTVASAITNPDPPSGKRALRIIRESDGSAEMASDRDILEAQRLLARTEGIFAEPAAAVPIACAKKMADSGVIETDERVVLIITGAGIKDADSALTTCTKPAELSSLDNVRDFLKGTI